MNGEARGGLPRVRVIGCGGSISSVRTGEGAVPTLDAGQLVAEIPELAQIAQIETESFAVIPSAHMTLDHVVALHGAMQAHAAGKRAPDGFVITHGTDTLEEVAFALDLLWGRPEPVVITGAMRNASLPSPDGPANIIASAATAASPGARGLGVLVVLNDEIHAARYVRKTHTSSLAAFRSPSAGPVGYLAEGKARIALLPQRRPPIEIGATPPSETPVALFTMGIGDDGRLLEHVLASGYRGLVIEAFGGGHLPREIAESSVFRELVDAIPVVLSSRTGAGEALRRSYSGWPGSEMELLDRGLVGSGILDGRKARILLTFLLASGAGREQIESMFAAHGLYGGEAESRVP